MKYLLLIFITSLLYASEILCQNISLEEYIEKYKKIAIEEMKRSGIRANITLAQGIVESSNGNSTLARKANNHFGIKCHKWNGKKFYQDDDEEDECFRKYNSPEESFRDHTDFLLSGSRYNFLFDFKSNDYKRWAKGLKKAGYATSRQYADDLIRTIKENELYRFDDEDYIKPPTKHLTTNHDNEYFTIDINRRKINELNRIKYIIIKAGDNLESLTKELDLFSWQLKKYNELPDKYVLVPGEKLFIQPKRWRAEIGNDFHFAKKNETMHSISQIYGIKINKLYRKNRMELGTEPFTGQKIWLRKRKPLEEKTKVEN
jgi:LysM repeat protein